VLAAVVVLMLFAGPAVVAHDDKNAAVTPVYGKSASGGGAQVFKGNCGSCHTLSAAGTTGQVGPNLDNISLSASEIESTVRSGRGAMPSFDGQLSGKQIAAVAAYVAASH
jgi:cytochrome c6